MAQIVFILTQKSFNLKSLKGLSYHDLGHIFQFRVWFYKTNEKKTLPKVIFQICLRKIIVIVKFCDHSQLYERLRKVFIFGIVIIQKYQEVKWYIAFESIICNISKCSSKTPTCMYICSGKILYYHHRAWTRHVRGNILGHNICLILEKFRCKIG